MDWKREVKALARANLGACGASSYRAAIGARKAANSAMVSCPQSQGFLEIDAQNVRQVNFDVAENRCTWSRPLAFATYMALSA